MRLPRDVSGGELVKRLGRLGYRVTRQSVGTLAAIIADIAAHQHLERDELVRKLFG